MLTCDYRSFMVDFWEAWALSKGDATHASGKYEN